MGEFCKSVTIQHRTANFFLEPGTGLHIFTWSAVPTLHDISVYSRTQQRTEAQKSGIFWHEFWGRFVKLCRNGGSARVRRKNRHL